MRFLPVGPLFLLLGCSGGAAREWALPAGIEGGWKLTVKPASPETLQLVQRLAPKKSMMASYEGPGTLQVSALELGSGKAFEEVQHWRARPGKIAFHHGTWFVVLECATLDAAQLSQIAASIEKSRPD